MEPISYFSVVLMSLGSNTARPMNQASVENLANYTRTGGLLIDAAIMQVDEQSVHLATTTMPQLSPNIELQARQDRL